MEAQRHDTSVVLVVLTYVYSFPMNRKGCPSRAMDPRVFYAIVELIDTIETGTKAPIFACTTLRKALIFACTTTRK